MHSSSLFGHSWNVGAEYNSHYQAFALFVIAAASFLSLSYGMKTAKAQT